MRSNKSVAVAHRTTAESQFHLDSYQLPKNYLNIEQLANEGLKLCNLSRRECDMWYRVVILTLTASKYSCPISSRVEAASDERHICRDLREIGRSQCSRKFW